MATMILVIGIAFAVCGQAWLIYVAYRHSPGWAIACFIPIVALIFAIINWNECKLPLGAQFLGLIITYNVISSSPFELIGGEVAAVRKGTLIVAESVRQYKKEIYKVPENSLDLLNAGMLGEENAYDPWGMPYNINSSQGIISIWSYGEDKSKDGDDNISFGYRWNM